MDLLNSLQLAIVGTEARMVRKAIGKCTKEERRLKHG
jgi:hypothetical protein